MPINIKLVSMKNDKLRSVKKLKNSRIKAVTLVYFDLNTIDLLVKKPKILAIIQAKVFANKYCHLHK